MFHTFEYQTGYWTNLGAKTGLVPSLFYFARSCWENIFKCFWLQQHEREGDVLFSTWVT
jgi:hypothetical protein